MKTTSIKANDFFRWFRKKVRDPLVAATGLTNNQKSFIDETLAMELYQRITRIENQSKNLTGLQKMNLLITEVQHLVIPQGLKELMPVVKLWAEQAVLYIYKTYFMEKFKSMGMHDWLEAFLGEDLDQDSDIGGKPTAKKETAATKPVFAPPAEDAH